MSKRFIYAIAAMLMLTTVNAQENWQKGKPNDDNYRYLDDYQGLKTYIDTERYPNFKLGVGTTVNEYLKKGTVYKMTNANFTETVAGNAMKMASCVDGNGNMNFSTVTNYVTAAYSAGINVYGHTLAWHSQQPKKWLLKLLEDKPAQDVPDGDVIMYTPIATKDFRTQQSVGWHSDQSKYGYTLSFDATTGLKVHTTKQNASWEVQYVALDNIPTVQNGSYKMTMMVRGTKAGTIHTKLGDWNSGATGDVQFTTAWKEVTMTYKSPVDNAFLMLQSGDFVGDIYIKDITISKAVKCKMITEDRRCIEVDASARENDVKDNQLLIFTGSFSANAQYVLSADVRADKEAKASTTIYAQPTMQIEGTTLGDINFTQQWKTIRLIGKFSKSGRYVVLNLSELEGSNKYYFDNISLKINGVEKVKNGDLEGTDVSSFSQKTAGGEVTACEIQDQIEYLYIPTPTPLTPQERHDTLVYAMDKWIKGMMSACFGKVKGWDLVNEAISGGGNDGDGYYELQHSEGYKSGTWDVGGDAFYWQDYMGDLEYVRQACRLARKYGPKDVKLIINDYNLEGTWDLMTKDGIRASKKLWSLVHWIEKWEADGVTHIDGIGTQMHISFNKNANAQNGLKAAITGMFQLMAKSGKMARVSELDMGYNDANGKSVPTAQMTEEQHKEMADFYEWIIKEYLSIIPPEQQWGICQWCATDSPANSGWRANTPVGIWDLSNYRKHVYAGFVRGLSSGTTDVDEVKVQEMPEIEDGAKIYDMFGRRMNATSIKDLPRGMYIVGKKKYSKM